MKNIRVKVRASYLVNLWWDYGIFEGNKLLVSYEGSWARKYAAIRNAKSFAKRVGIKFDPEIMKQQ